MPRGGVAGVACWQLVILAGGYVNRRFSGDATGP